MARFELRLSDEDRVRWRQAASLNRLPLSIFIRRCVEDVIEGKVGPPAMADEDFKPVAPSVMRAIPARKTQLELEAEEQEEPERPNPFRKDD